MIEGETGEGEEGRWKEGEGSTKTNSLWFALFPSSAA